MKLLQYWDDLVVPEDLVYFRRSQNLLVANPELAAWCMLDEQDMGLLRQLTAVPRGPRPDTDDTRTEKFLARLVLKWMVYIPGHRPAVRPAEPALTTVYYAITDGCNLRCPYCYASSEKRLPGELSTQESLDVVEQAAAMGVKQFIFTGGEPMLRKDLFDVAGHARSLGMTVNMITNATLIRKAETARRIADTFHTVTVSIDGGTEELHERTRGKGTFARTREGLRLLNEAGVIPTINHVVTPDNVDALEDLCDFVGDLKVRRVRMMYHSDLGRAATDGYEFGWSEFQKIQKFMWTNPKADNLLPDGPTASKPCSIAGNCGMGGNEIYVNSLGTVYPCKLVTERVHKAGNIRQQTLAEIFATPLLADMRHNSVFEGDNLSDCRRCYIRAACGGGCRAYHLAETGDIHRNGRHLCRTLRHSMITSWWRANGVTGPELLANQAELLLPRMVRDDSVHPVYEDWKLDGRRLLPLAT
ncbi:StsB family radical SAM/SPASM domain sactipeptide maturase [Streptomyces sp. NBC_01190]|uniref:StsB family radical SAM/SPASM domain sactipeptide maturase n=1 Tax=Streptomyces sp. NBC_01190 TaxID=2903767 RepID=UPI003863205E|nr:radical SAM protein [Streptomyces sp. NBC_01190]